MFMASSLLSRVDNGAHGAAVGALLTGYAQKLQRPDGLFIHAQDGPHPWGRGNGFALLGVTEALTHLPEGVGRSTTRARDLSQTCQGAGRPSIG